MNLPKLLEIASHGLALCFPGESADKELGVSGVTKGGVDELKS